MENPRPNSAFNHSQGDVRRKRAGSCNYSKPYGFVSEPSLSNVTDQAVALGLSWRRSAVESVWNAVCQGRLTFASNRFHTYHFKAAPRPEPVERWRIMLPIEGFIDSSKDEGIMAETRSGLNQQKEQDSEII